MKLEQSILVRKIYHTCYEAKENNVIIAIYNVVNIVQNHRTIDLY